MKQKESGQEKTMRVGSNTANKPTRKKVSYILSKKTHEALVAEAEKRGMSVNALVTLFLEEKVYTPVRGNK